MPETGSDNEADLWANTGNQPSVPPVPPLTSEAPGAAADPTMVQPALPSEPASTTVQPATPGPLDTPAAGANAAGYVTGPGAPPPAPPPAQPPAPPTGGPGRPGGPAGPGQGRPAWVTPAAIGVLVAVIGAGLIYLITRDGGDDSVSTDVAVTAIPESTIEGATTIPAETTIVAETTIEIDTTIAAETTVAPAPTTAAPAAAAPTTAAPTTSATTTAPAEGVTPAQPGQALVAGDAYDLVSGCTTNPVPGYSVRSYVAMGDSGPLIIEEGNDEGNAFGFFSDGGVPVETGEYTKLGDGFGMVAFQGDSGFEVAVDPGDIALGDCSTRGSARLSDPAAPEFGYTYGIVDICATTDPFRAIAYISEGGNIRVVDNGNGTAQVTLNTSDLFDATDPAATITTASGRQVITGEITGSTFDGDTTQALQFEFDNTSTRACTGNESP